DRLESRGAAFAIDLAHELGLEPSRTRAALEGLLGLGLATNDRFDPLRPSAGAQAEALARTSIAAAAPPGPLGQARGSLRRTASARPEGRWAQLVAPATDPESAHLAWAAALIERFGVLARETVALDPWAPPWRDMAPWLARAELRGELRRGYFVA